MPLADQQLTLEHEKSLWDTKELDLDTSKGLLRAVIFYLVKCFAVWQGKELRQLQTSHVSFGENKLGKYVALDLQSSTFKRKRFVKRYDDPANPRSVYKIMKKYQSRIANEGSFLVRPISSIKDFICYGPLPLGINVIKTFIPTLMEDAGIGRCFVNHSLNLQSIDILMRFGTGFHCLSSWLMKNNMKSFPPAPECSSSNCEELNPEVSVMMSRLLDAPYPCDAVEIIQKMEDEEKQRSKEKQLPQRFDSWMTNLMVCDEPLSKPEESLTLDGKETERESPVSHNSGCKVNIVSSTMKGNLPNDAGQTRDSTRCKAETDSPELKIMTVSTISEAAFSHQVDEGSQIEGQERETDEQSCSSVSSENKMKNRSKIASICGKKRKGIIQKSETLSDKVHAKVAKLDNYNGDAVSTNKSEESKSEENVGIGLNSDTKNIPKIAEIKLNHDTIKVKGLGPEDERKGKNYGDKDGQNLQSTCVDGDLVSDSNKSSVVMAGETSKESNSLKESSSGGQFSMPNPDSSQDSITILRMLLRQQSDDKDKVNVENGGKCKDKDCDVDEFTDEEKDRNPVNGILSENVERDVSTTEDDKMEIHSYDGDSHIKVEREIDLSPPTLSPQIPISMLDNLDDAASSKNFDSLSNDASIPSNQCAPSLVSSDIVQFLDKAQQQIKSILSATSPQSNVHTFHTKCESPVKALNPRQPETERGMSFKHTRKSRRPVKVTTSVLSDEESPSEEFDTCADPKSMKLKLSEQSQSHFPLLRLFLEQPINETEKVMASGSSMNTPPKTKYKQDTLLPNSSHSCNELSEPPKLTYMGNTITSQEIQTINDDHVNDESVQSNIPTLTKGKDPSNLNALPDSLIECSQVISPSSSGSNLSPLPASSSSTLLNFQKANTASYHVEKNLVHNVVYQTLHVNYEKDGVRTFTFADIPNIPDTASNSKRFPSNMQTSDINLGDYFPPGTLIPAKDIHLATQQGPQGCDIVMKFSFSSQK